MAFSPIPSPILIVGLGNPGREYEDTRHNIGFRLIDAFAQTLQISWSLEKKHQSLIAKGILHGRTVILSKPQTFMNLSGSAIQSLASFYKIPPSHTIIVYDDITLSFSRVKITQSGSSGGHNGVKNTISHIGPDFIRYRIGIGPKKHPEMDLANHVLSSFSIEEKSILEAQMKKFIDYLNLLIDKGVIFAMNVIDQRLISQ